MKKLNMGKLVRRVRKRWRRVRLRGGERLGAVLVPLFTRRIAGPRPPVSRPDECIACVLVRDGEVYLKDFLRHYDRLGVRHLIVLDNGSVDNTVALASGAPNVTVLRCRLSFRYFEYPMKRLLLRLASRGAGWSLLVDIDEFFDYPGSDAISLSAFLRRLNASGYDAVAGYLLDMFPGPDTPLSASEQDFRSQHDTYDISCVSASAYPDHLDVVQPKPRVPVYRGGVRTAMFGLDNVLLIKHPLLRCSHSSHWVDPHWVKDVRLADVTTVLLHYKFAGDFVQKVTEAAREERYPRALSEYRAYWDVTRSGEPLAFPRDSACRFENAWELVDRGFLAAPASYREYCAKNGGPAGLAAARDRAAAAGSATG
ncbi:MAG: glycosyltransferase family 2 protein [Proteobacteria bacterium]|nr:glycosyltransferase family 2 protein [Pseudomonadota bacterium]